MERRNKIVQSEDVFLSMDNPSLTLIEQNKMPAS